MMMKRMACGVLVCCLAAAAVVLPRGEAIAAGVGSGGGPAAFEEITPASRRAVEKGLAYLASIQQDDGSFGETRYGAHVGITSLACLAFMADGHMPGRGPYGEVVSKGLDFVLDHATESGLIAANTSHGPMYGHGFATLFLGEVYGMTGDPRCREALLKAVRLIVRTQNPEGGWRYQPVPVDADISVTICQVMALRAARNAGLSVPKTTIDRAVSYVRRCQNPGDGGFRYTLSGGGSLFPRSAAGVATLFYAGIYEDEAIERGLEYVHDTGGDHSFAEGSHFFYGHYYASQAMFLAGGEHWARWFPSIRDMIVEAQNSNGSWRANHGNSYGTAMCLLAIQVPNRLLPIFQR